ncbi:MAG: T9SS type A sorting domain-containing protein [Saprospiraceae bacterium]|nr:T9SS type A sorting domain-containing protein [Saprospiraceae bacterium]
MKQKESNKFNNLGTITSQRDRIQIELNEEISDKALNLQIINFDGKLVRSLDLEKGKKQMQVSISQLNPGNYIAILKEGQKLISKAIILKQ